MVFKALLFFLMAFPALGAEVAGIKIEDKEKLVKFYRDEGYIDAEGVLTHLDNVGALLAEALTIADLTRLEIHGPETELAKLRVPLAQFNPQFFVLEYGFRR